MQYVSTRGGVPAASYSEIVLQGLARDGGLFVPKVYPQVSKETLKNWRGLSYAQLATAVTSLFAKDMQRSDIARLCETTYTPEVYCHGREGTDFKKIAPVVWLENDFGILELSNGPTLAFKDMAMQYLGSLFEFVLARKETRLNILGATSGDTGSAAEYAMKGREGIQVFMLSPAGRMSRFQKAQMYSLQDKNIFNIAVQGSRGNMVMGKTRIEALDNSLFDKLQVFDGDISPMLEPDNNAIAIAVSLDDYGNLPNLEYYPKVGDTITATYADDVKYIDSRTGELCTEDTPEEYLQAKLYGARDVAYTVCALVELPYSMSYRYGGIGYETVLSVDTAQRDSGGAAIPLLYLFDTADEADEAEAEQYLSKLTAGEFSPLMYESKATARSEFAQFRQMFLLIGGILCAIIGLVGLLNFFNAMMTGILSRRREFAVLQAVGMTNRQLKTMLIYEGLFYAMSSVAAAFILSLAVGPLAGKMLGSMFWFFEYRFTILPVLLTIPVFLLLGWLIPCMMYDNAAKCSVVEQLRDAQ